MATCIHKRKSLEKNPFPSRTKQTHENVGGEIRQRTRGSKA